jgi:hypothetical protein
MRGETGMRGEHSYSRVAGWDGIDGGVGRGRGEGCYVKLLC